MRFFKHILLFFICLNSINLMADNDLEPFEMIVISIDTMNKNLGNKENKEKYNNNIE